jgi:hypothetical protein
MISFFEDPTSYTVVLEGRPYTRRKDEISITDVENAIQDDNVDFLKEVFIPIQKVKAALKGEGRIEVTGSEVLYAGSPIEGAIVERVLKRVKEGLNVQGLLRYLEKREKNPSMHSRNQLDGFVERHKVPITDDGDLVLYKGVQKDYKSYTSGKNGKVDWSPGRVVKEDRRDVDDNPNIHCSHGLHACSYPYMKNWWNADKWLMVLVSPEHVVSVPADCDGSKVRFCEAYVPKDGDITGTEKVEQVKDWEGPEYSPEEDEDEDEWGSMDDEEGEWITRGRPA